jgi:prepilin-type N-terminal cleavage/methylation domain-containing protein
MIQARTTLSRRGFTLIELIAVLVVLAILSGVALPKYFDYREKAQISAAQGARAALSTAVVNMHLANQSEGIDAYPASLGEVLDNDDSKHLYNPWWTPGMPVYIDDPNAGPEKMFVQTKLLDQSPRPGAYGSGAIWYNPTNGQVNFRVPRQSTGAETLELFNLVNQTNCSSMNQTAVN